jgi:hypothetical protein
VAREAEERLLDLEVETGQVDAGDADGSADKVADVVVVVDRERQVDVRTILDRADRLCPFPRG